MEDPRIPKKKETIPPSITSPNQAVPPVNDKPVEKKRKVVDWLGDRLVEKLDRDHYMCIICFKRMSRGYASCHCNEDHQNISDEMKPFIVKAYRNGRKISDDLYDSKMDEMKESQMKSKKDAKQIGQAAIPPLQTIQMQIPPPPNDGKITDPSMIKEEKTDKKIRSRMTAELKKKYERLDEETKHKWETKPKKELEKQRTAEGKRVTMEISKIMAHNGIPFAKSDAIWKIVHEIMGSTNKLGPQVLEKIRFSARTLKRRYDESTQPNKTTTTLQNSTNATENQLPQPTNTQVQSVFTQNNAAIVMNPIINDRTMPTAVPNGLPMDMNQ